MYVCMYVYIYANVLLIMYYVSTKMERVIPCQVNQIFSTFEPDPLGFFFKFGSSHVSPQIVQIFIF